MRPSLNPDTSVSRDVVSVNLSSWWFRQYRRGEVVALKSPQDPKLWIIKRIIALEGDLVQTLPPYSIREVRVPPGHVWVEGRSSRLEEYTIFEFGTQEMNSSIP